MACETQITIVKFARPSFCGSGAETKIYRPVIQVWDRRSKFISPEESEKWKDVHPVMMSDEETLDSKTLKRKRPEWRSTQLNNMIDDIETLTRLALNILVKNGCMVHPGNAVFHQWPRNG